MTTEKTKAPEINLSEELLSRCVRIEGQHGNNVGFDKNGLSVFHIDFGKFNYKFSTMLEARGFVLTGNSYILQEEYDRRTAARYDKYVKLLDVAFGVSAVDGSKEGDIKGEREWYCAGSRVGDGKGIHWIFEPDEMDKALRRLVTMRHEEKEAKKV